jgi:hypothetical protein
MSVPGIGPIISSAMVAAIGTGEAFSKGRDFAAWLGLVPKQMSTGDRTILGKMFRVDAPGAKEGRPKPPLKGSGCHPTGGTCVSCADSRASDVL